MFISNSVEQTIAAGRTYGEKARRGDVFALRGDLGAGKTQFVKGFVAGLGSNADVTSPTFVLLHEYGESHDQLAAGLVGHRFLVCHCSVSSGSRRTGHRPNESLNPPPLLKQQWHTPPVHFHRCNR